MRPRAKQIGFPGRRALVLGAFTLATAGLLWRVVDLQLNHKDFLQRQGDARHLRVVTVAADRGKVTDRTGQPLAMSTPVDSVWGNPAELLEARDRLPGLARVLGLEPADLGRAMDERAGREFVYLRRHVQPDIAERVRGLDVPGVYLQREYRRYYPLGEAAAHVVGFTNVDDLGQEGIELAYEARLRGQPGARRVVRDRLGRIVEEVERIRPARAGQDLRLSLDERVQYMAYRALLGGVRRHRAKGGSAVVLDAYTGEVLAMVNQPAYNPNNPGERESARYRNRAVTDVFEPGSTVKPFTVAAALESGRFRPDTMVDTSPGELRVGAHTVHDHRNYGRIDVATIITKSSNVGASKLALAIDAEQLWRTFSRVGFGATTASGFPGEAEGVLSHYSRWREIHRVTASYGYGLSVTTLQLAQAYAVLANGGLLPRLSFLRVTEPEEWVRVMAEETTRQVREMLATVVGPAGTGRRGAVAGYRIGGKTGTVRKSIAGGYSEDRYVALFAGIAPLSAPRLVAVVMVDEPAAGKYYGGEVAAPIFRELMDGALRLRGVAPDDLPSGSAGADLHAAVQGAPGRLQ